MEKAFSEECKITASCGSTEEKRLMLTMDHRLERYRRWSPYHRASAAAIATPLPIPTFSNRRQHDTCKDNLVRVTSSAQLF